MIQVKDDAQNLRNSGRIALARKSKSGPQGHLPVQLQGAGSCFHPSKTERALGRAQGNNGPMHREATALL